MSKQPDVKSLSVYQDIDVLLPGTLAQAGRTYRLMPEVIESIQDFYGLRPTELVECVQGASEPNWAVHAATCDAGEATPLHLGWEAVLEQPKSTRAVFRSFATRAHPNVLVQFALERGWLGRALAAHELKREHAKWLAAQKKPKKTGAKSKTGKARRTAKVIVTTAMLEDLAL